MTIGSTPGIGHPHAADANASPTPEKLHTLAQQFEALLIGEMLKTIREAAKDSGNDDSDSGSESAMDMAQAQFAQAIAAQGGLGLSHMIETGLARDSANQKVSATEPAPIGARS